MRSSSSYRIITFPDWFFYNKIDMSKIFFNYITSLCISERNLPLVSFSRKNFFLILFLWSSDSTQTWLGFSTKSYLFLFLWFRSMEIWSYFVNWKIVLSHLIYAKNRLVLFYLFVWVIVPVLLNGIFVRINLSIELKHVK